MDRIYIGYLLPTHHSVLIFFYTIFSFQINNAISLFLNNCVVRVVPAGAYVWKGGTVKGSPIWCYSLSTSQKPFKVPLNELSSGSGVHSFSRSGSTLGVVRPPFVPGCGLRGYRWWPGLLRVHSLFSTSWTSERLLCSLGWLPSLFPPTHIRSVQQWIQRPIDCFH